MKGWWICRQPLPVFADADLEERSAIHSDRCPAQADTDGKSRSTLCRCLGAVYVLKSGTPVLTLYDNGEAQLVRLIDSGSFWVESKVSKISVKAPQPTQRFVYTRHQPFPPDYTALQSALVDGKMKLLRRRRPLRGGELCFVRGDADQHPWRFLGQIWDGVQRSALLLDAEVRAERALGPHWNQQTIVSLMRDGQILEPHQVLYPVFPLPDGTKDPGWIDV